MDVDKIVYDKNIKRNKINYEKYTYIKHTVPAFTIMIIARGDLIELINNCLSCSA